MSELTPHDLVFIESVRATFGGATAEVTEQLLLRAKRADDEEPAD